MEFKKIEDCYIKEKDIVSVKEMGNIVEITYVQHKNNRQTIKDISKLQSSNPIILLIKSIKIFDREKAIIGVTIIFEKQMNDLGVIVHAPKYGAWLPKDKHRKTAYNYNEKWKAFLNKENLSVEDIEKFANALMKELYE